MLYRHYKIIDSYTRSESQNIWQHSHFFKGDYLHFKIVGFEFGVYAAHHSTWDCTTVNMFLLLFKRKKNFFQ